MAAVAILLPGLQRFLIFVLTVEIAAHLFRVAWLVDYPTEASCGPGTPMSSKSRQKSPNVPCGLPTTVLDDQPELDTSALRYLLPPFVL